MLSIDDVSGESLRSSHHLKNQLHDILVPSYVDPRALLARELAGCTHAYLARSIGGDVQCFFLTARHWLDVDSQLCPAVHLGLSATRHQAKGRGHVVALYRRCIHQSLEWQGQLGCGPVLWSTTASPVVYLTVTRGLRNAEPTRDGGYSPKGAMIAQALRRRLGASAVDAVEHPFVLRGIASGTRYSHAEVRRLEDLARLKAFDMFTRLGVEEANHDRLLFIAGLPPESDHAP